MSRNEDEVKRLLLEKAKTECFFFSSLLV